MPKTNKWKIPKRIRTNNRNCKVEDKTKKKILRKKLKNLKELVEGTISGIIMTSVKTLKMETDVKN